MISSFCAVSGCAVVLSVGGSAEIPPQLSAWIGDGILGSLFAGPWSERALGMEGALAVGWGPQDLRPPSVCPSEPPVLYPNLAELENYMGLALSSEEIQKNLHKEGSTVGVCAGSSLPHGSPCQNRAPSGSPSCLRKGCSAPKG